MSGDVWEGPGWSPGVENVPASSEGGDSLGNYVRGEGGPSQEWDEEKLSLILCNAEAIQWLSQPFCPGALWSLTLGLYAGSKPELGRELP